MRVESVDYEGVVRLSEHTGELDRLRACGDDDRIDRAFNAVCKKIWGYTLDDFDDESLSSKDHAFLDRLTWKRACAFALAHGYDLVDRRTGNMVADWWGFAWHQFSQHPFTGLGAYAAGKFAVLGNLKVNASTLHSDYMEVLVGTGFWGMVPLLLAIIGTWWLLLRYVRDLKLPAFERQLAFEAACILAVGTVRSFFDTEFIWHAPLLFLVILGYAELLRRQHERVLERARAAQFEAFVPA